MAGIKPKLVTFRAAVLAPRLWPPYRIRLPAPKTLIPGHCCRDTHPWPLVLCCPASVRPSPACTAASHREDTGKWERRGWGGGHEARHLPPSQGSAPISEVPQQAWPPLTVISINGGRCQSPDPGDQARLSAQMTLIISVKWSMQGRRPRPAPRPGLSLKMTSPCRRISAKFSPCDLQVKDQGAPRGPASDVPITHSSKWKRRVSRAPVCHLLPMPPAPPGLLTLNPWGPRTQGL